MKKTNPDPCSKNSGCGSELEKNPGPDPNLKKNPDPDLNLKKIRIRSLDIPDLDPNVKISDPNSPDPIKTRIQFFENSDLDYALLKFWIQIQHI